jgi:excisionase family DNA binding protein
MTPMNARPEVTPNIAEPVAPTADETRLARESGRRLSPYTGQNLQVQIAANGCRGETVELPASAVQLLVRILDEMAVGNAITLVGVHAELTTQQAADLLNVSRAFMVKLLDEGAVPSTELGTERHVHLSDLMKYKHQSDAARAEVLADLVADGQEQQMGY